jgi:hypothetical protein
MKRFAASLIFTLALPLFLAASGPGAVSAAPLGGCTPLANPYANPNLPAQVCGTGVNSTPMDAAYEVQRTQVWCWAASLSMVMAFYGKDVSQKAIVTSIYGAAVPEALNSELVGRYLNRTYADGDNRATVSSRPLFVSGSQNAGALDAIVAEMRSGHPMLLFTPTHVMVMTGIYYYADSEGNPTGVRGVIVRDPFPYDRVDEATPGIPISGHPGERVLAPQEYYSLVAAVAVRIS